MNKVFSLFILAAFFTISSFAQIALEQSVIATGGEYVSKGSISVSWTLGELAITTLTDGNMILTQGFQQPLAYRTNIAAKEMDWKISAYPIPFRDVLFVKFEIDRTKEFRIEIQDMTGRVMNQMHQREIPAGDVIQINTSELIMGVYFLKVFTADPEQLQILSISKTESPGIF